MDPAVAENSERNMCLKTPRVVKGLNVAARFGAANQQRGVRTLSQRRTPPHVSISRV